MIQPLTSFNIQSLPDAPDMMGQLSRFFSDSLAQAAGLDIEPVATDPTQINIQIETWQDWVRLIAGFRSLADWHKQAWTWAWRLRFGEYQPPFVAIAARGSGKSSTAEAIISALGAKGARKYVLYVRATQAQANSSIANIASSLENSAIKDYYPLMGQRLVSVFGQSKGWNRTMLRTANDFTVAAFGLDSALRGSKVDDYRPDLICHKVGTQVFDPDLECWCKVEDHPGLIKIQPGPGVQVVISGAPEPEIVTPEHRYWARQTPPDVIKMRWAKYDPDPQWVEAKHIQVGWHFLGLPIDQTQIEPQPIKTMGVDPQHLLSVSLWVGAHSEAAVPSEFNDPEWWWFFGLWWRYGGFDQAQLYIGFRPDGDTRNAQRLMDLLQKYNIAAERRQERRSENGKQRSSYRLLFRHDTFYRWLRSWTNIDDSQRVPPLWVEQLRHDLQKALVKGYLNLDNNTDPKNGARAATSRVEDFLSLRRILARLGVSAIVYRNKITDRGYKEAVYTLYARDGVRDNLGLNVDPSKAPYTNCFIRDDHLWSRVTDVTPVNSAMFAPITTKSHTYHTHFGLSHNCLDDLDEKHDSPGVTKKKIDTITTSILPAGSADMTVLAIQNKILDDGIFARLADGTADFLADRILVGPIPAVEGLEYKIINNVPIITAGHATWEGQSLEVCEQQMRTWGIRAFRAEAQHETGMMEGGTFNNLTYSHIAEDDVPELKDIVCWIDPAVSTTTRSDCQAIQIDGIEYLKDPRKRPIIFRLYSWEGIDTPSNAIKRALREGCARHVKKIGIETNQGGDLWEDEYLTIAGDMLDAEEIEYIPTFDSAKAGAHTGSKEDRAGRMLTDYTRGYIVHVYGTHGTLESALGRFPLIAPDDLVDASFWAWDDLRKKDKYRGKPRYARVSRDKLFNQSGGLRGNTRASHLRRLGLRR